MPTRRPQTATPQHDQQMLLHLLSWLRAQARTTEIGGTLEAATHCAFYRRAIVHVERSMAAGQITPRLFISWAKATAAGAGTRTTLEAQATAYAALVSAEAMLLMLDGFEPAESSRARAARTVLLAVAVVGAIVAATVAGAAWMTP